MKLIFKVPFEVSIIGPSPESFDIITSFKHKSYVVRVSFSGKIEDKPKFFESLPDNEKYLKEITHLTFEIEADESTKKGRKLLNLVEDKEKRYDLLLFLTEVVNRVILNIRNFGIVPHIHEIKPKQDKTKGFLRRWSVKISKEGEEFSPLIAGPKDLEEYIEEYLMGQDINIKIISISKWSEIEEAIQDNLPSPPEQELFTNAIEFLRVRNYRMALLESVTCLEIVLSQYLNEYLYSRKDLMRLSNELINDFLYRVGLKDKISILLDLVLGQEGLKYINKDNVLKAIEWRNRILHRTGHLPNGISDDDLKQKVKDTITLASILARERDQIIAEPSLIDISKNIAKKYNIPTPTILLPGPKHKIHVKINFFLETPDKKIFKAICEDLIKIFKNQDNRFNESEHLLVTFIKFPNKTIAYWLNNKLIFYKN